MLAQSPEDSLADFLFFSHHEQDQALGNAVTSLDTEAVPLQERPAVPSRLRIGDWIADPQLDELQNGDQRIKLEPRKMQLLLALARRPGQLVTTDELFDAVWKDVVVTPSSIYQSIAQLRKILGDDTGEPRYIATVPRKGYRLVAAVSPVEPLHQATPPPGLPLLTGNDLPPTSIANDGLGAETAAARGLSWSRRTLLAAGAAAATVTLGSAALWLRSRPLPADAVVRVAVLPFADLSPGGIELPLAEGLADDVIAGLARHPQIRVAARNSAVQVQRASLSDVGAQLNVTHVLSGELFRTRERVRVTARLMRVGETSPLWFEIIERPVSSLATLPSLLTQGVLNALRLPTQVEVPSASAEAYELTLLGRHATRAWTPEGILKGRDYFQRAIDVDPTYAPAYVYLGLSWIFESHFGSTIYPREAAARAQPLLDKALALAPDLAEAHAANGHAATQMLQYDLARKHLARALELQPGYAQAWFWLGYAAAGDGNVDEALKHYARASELDPLSFILQGLRGVTSILAGRFDEAQVHYARAVQLAPDHPNSRWGAGILGYARGRLDDAVKGYRHALAADSRRRDLWFELGWVYLDLGMAREADAAFSQMKALSKVALYGPLAASRVLFITGRSSQIPDFLRQNGLPGGEYGHVYVDCATLLAAIGRAPDARDWLTRGLAQQQADPVPLQRSWDVFRGYFPTADIASVYVALGEPAAAQPFIDQASAYLTHYESRGNVWHAGQYQRARIAAISGQPEAAFAALDKAVAMGWRRAWWARFDPALASLRNTPRFATAMDRVDSDVAEQRARVGVST